MWDLPGPGIEPVSPALAGGFLTTVPPGNSQAHYFLLILHVHMEWLKVCSVLSSLQDPGIGADCFWNTDDCPGREKTQEEL